VAYKMPDPDLYITLGKSFNLDEEILRPREVVRIQHDVRFGHGGRAQLVPFAPDTKHVFNQIAAAINRFGRDMPLPSDRMAAKFRAFAKHFLSRNFRKCEERDFISFAEWLDRGCYSKAKIKTLLNEYLSCIMKGATTKPGVETCSSESHLKCEDYQEPKHPRAINSLSDFLKLLVCTICKAVDKATYDSHWFVKGVNPSDYPAFLKDKFASRPVVETDFTSFECHHRDIYIEILYEYWFEDRLTGIIDEHNLALIKSVMLGISTSHFKNIKVQIPQRLMSGALWTSSSNGVLNLLIMAFYWAQSLHPEMPPEEQSELATNEFNAVLEGDDAISDDFPENPAILEELGVLLKLEKAQSFGLASFCGCVCDESALTAIYDPVKFLRCFQFHQPVKEGGQCRADPIVVRSKALSYNFVYGSNPVIGAVCQWMLRHTRGSNTPVYTKNIPYRLQGVDFTKVDASLPKREPTDGEREVCHIIYGITPARQMEIEKIFKSGGPNLDIDLSDLQTEFDKSHSEKFLVYEDVVHIPIVAPPEIEDILRTGSLGLPPVEAARRLLMSGFIPGKPTRQERTLVRPYLQWMESQHMYANEAHTDCADALEFYWSL